ncbi:MAG TPA: hypothetical protein VFJ85_06725 [Acidimicrobiales bacterium]|nr:hypothetical protein [Acidimicrobiales bacterium]
MVGFSRRHLFSLALVALLLSACSAGGGGTPAGGASASGSTSTSAAGGFTVVGTDVQAMASPAPAFPAAVTTAVTTTLDRWLDAAVLGPLRTGSRATGLEAVFTDQAQAALAPPGQQRASMVEDGTAGSGSVTKQKADAKLTALTSQTGDVVLVTAQVETAHAVRTGGGTVDVVRSGEVVLVPAASGWRIDAFDMAAKHDTRPR